MTATDFARKSLPAEVLAIVTQAGIAPGQLWLELTERMMMNSLEDVIGVMRELRQI